MDMKMDDTKPLNYNSCDNDLCKVTRQSLCHFVILFPWGSYMKESLLVENKSSIPICAKVDGEANWIDPKNWFRFYNNRKPRLNEIFTEKNERITFREQTKDCECECYLCVGGLCKIC